MRTTRSISHLGGGGTRHPLWPGTPLGPGTSPDQAPPWDQVPPPPGTSHPPDQAPSGTRHSLWDQAPPGTRHLPGTRHPTGADPPGADPPGPGTTPHPRADPPLWTEFLTHASENITLPQTSFAGGNEKHSSGMPTARLPTVRTDTTENITFPQLLWRW